MTERDPHNQLGDTAVAADTVGLLECLLTTRAIRRYRDEPIPPDALRDIMFAATRAPSGSNRQPFRFFVLTDSDTAVTAKRMIADAAAQIWQGKRQTDRYDDGSGSDATSPKARMAQAMQGYIDNLHRVPALVLACLERYRAPNPMEGASVFPACQNLLLAARALGYGGVLTGFHSGVSDDLHRLLAIPDEVPILATITLGRPVGNHGPVRRRPMGEVVFGDRWGEGAAWATDPPGTQHTAAGPPRSTTR